METAMADIKQRLKYSINIPEDTYRTVFDVFQSLLRLAQLQIYNSDFHLGNVFLVYKPGYSCQFKIVISDFDESIISNSPTTSSSVLFQFIKSLSEALIYYDKPDVMIILDTFFQKIGNISGKYEIDFDKYLEYAINENKAIIRYNTEFV